MEGIASINLNVDNKWGTLEKCFVAWESDCEAVV